MTSTTAQPKRVRPGLYRAEITTIEGHPVIVTIERADADNAQRYDWGWWSVTLTDHNGISDPGAYDYRSLKDAWRTVQCARLKMDRKWGLVYAD